MMAIVVVRGWGMGSVMLITVIIQYPSDEVAQNVLRVGHSRPLQREVSRMSLAQCTYCPPFPSLSPPFASSERVLKS